jgi:two-component system OmpR family response regulator
VLRVGDLELDRLERRARRGARAIDLPPREYQLLDYLMRREGQLVTRPMLFQEMWNYRFVPATNLVDVHLGRLRRKVDSSADAPMIESVRGAGFMLRAAL